MADRGHWWVGSITAIITAAIASVGSYYASGAGSSADAVKENEHRLTKLEDSIAAHVQADALERTEDNAKIGNIWCAIRVNHGEACNP